MSTSPDQPPATANWWSSFFDDDYASFGLSGTPDDLLQQVTDFLWRTLELQPGQTVFDQCCGIGRISLPLAQRGVNVIGVDQSTSYATAAQREADRRNLNCRFHCDDAFEFVSLQPCDAAVNWFTSFGYLPDDAANVRMLHRVMESLKPGGRFVLDSLNLPKVFADFHTNRFERSNAPEQDGLIILYENTPNFMTGMLDSDWTLIRADGRRDVRRVTTRMYLPNDYVRMFRANGFEDVKLFGWLDGEPLTRLSRRCIVFGRKPA